MKIEVMVLSVLLLTAGEILAQSDLASITGNVKDPSGAVVAGAQIYVTNASDDLQASSVTNAAGVYTVLNLPIGDYRLVCSKEGFKKYERSEIKLTIGQVAEIDAVLTVGASTETLAVTRDAQLLQTQTSSISTSLGNAAISELPLNVQGGRNLSAFMFAYVPGVEGSGSTPQNQDYTSHINGSLSQNKEVMIDGTSAVSQIGGYLSESSPPMEAVEEFQVTSAGVRADDGRTGGGVFRYEMKSGTNAWHGSGFYYMHNEAFDARSFGDVYNQEICLGASGGNSVQLASCKRGFGKPRYRLYDYGASFGGPIKKDKLFFYAAWERYTFANAGVGALSSTVPTPAFLGGDFSSLLGGTLCNGSGGIALCNGYPASGNPTPVMVQNDAGRTVPAQQNMIFDPAPNACGAPPCQFTGNVIPLDRISKVRSEERR